MLLRGAFDVVYLLCAVQGVITGALLLLRKANRAANRYLAVGVFGLAYCAAYALYVRSGAFESNGSLLFTAEPMQLLFGPAFYLYARTLVRPASPSRRPWVHFLPFATFYVWCLPRILLSGQEKMALVAHERVVGGPVAQLLWQCAIEIQGAAYLFAAVVFLVRFKRDLEGEHSDLEARDVAWLRLLLSSLLTLWLASSLAFVTGLPILPWVHLGITVIVYAIAHRGRREQDRAAHDAPPASALDVALPKYRKSRLRDDEVRLVEQRLRASFAKDKPYRESDLTLSALAARIGVPTHQLSQILNERLETTFHDYVNRARVEEVKQRIAEEASANVLEIALDCGFASKSSFNANFRKHTGLSPTAFRASLRQTEGPEAATAFVDLAERV